MEYKTNYDNDSNKEGKAGERIRKKENRRYKGKEEERGKERGEKDG